MGVREGVQQVGTYGQTEICVNMVTMADLHLWGVGGGWLVMYWIKA